MNRPDDKPTNHVGHSQRSPAVERTPADATESQPILGDETIQWIGRLQSDAERALGESFNQYRDRLWRVVAYRVDPRLRGRVDPEDVLQESYLAAQKRLNHYLAHPNGSWFIWLRLIVLQTLTDVHRRHLGAQMRDAGRDISIDMPASGVGNDSLSSSGALAGRLLGHLSSPSHAALKTELSEQLRQALDQMSELDREVIALRHFEELTNSEVAEVLQIQPKAASIRYVRAIARLKNVLERIPGFFDS